MILGHFCKLSWGRHPSYHPYFPGRARRSLAWGVGKGSSDSAFSGQLIHPVQTLGKGASCPLVAEGRSTEPFSPNPETCARPPFLPKAPLSCRESLSQVWDFWSFSGGNALATWGFDGFCHFRKSLDWYYKVQIRPGRCQALGCEPFSLFSPPS